jgi:HEAT repeat protein
MFTPYLESTDDQVRLEAAITLGETDHEGTVQLLASMLDDQAKPYFFRSAAAWALGRVGGTDAVQRLVRAFADIQVPIREEALEGLARVGEEAVPVLLAGLADVDGAVAAGCAEALRRRGLTTERILEAAQQIRFGAPPKWAVWLLGNLPRESVAPVIAEFQEQIPGVHYAMTLLWSFTESWVARRWELLPRAVYPDGD